MAIGLILISTAMGVVSRSSPFSRFRIGIDELLGLVGAIIMVLSMIL